MDIKKRLEFLKKKSISTSHKLLKKYDIDIIELILVNSIGLNACLSCFFDSMVSSDRINKALKNNISGQEICDVVLFIEKLKEEFKEIHAKIEQMFIGYYKSKEE